MKKVEIDIQALDKSSFSVIRVFTAQAIRDGWEKEEIEEVQKEAMSGDYKHLLNTVAKYCK